MAKSVKQSALEYAANGWYVVALHRVRDDGTCSCGRECTEQSRGKHPRLDLCRNGLKDATRDPKVIATWPEDINIGVVLGERSGGVMVFDVDNLDVARKLLGPEMAIDAQTGVVFTGRGGCHIWFVTSGETVTRHLRTEDGRLGELRGDGAYVVVPPSQGSERAYTWRGARGSIPKPSTFQHVKDSIGFVREILEGVDVALFFREDSEPSTDVPLDAIYPTKMPDAIGHDSRMFEFRGILSGNIRAPQSDRSGQLFKLANLLAEVALDREVDGFGPEQAAGVLKEYDLKAFTSPKFADRTNADEMYWKTARRAFGDARRDRNSAPERPVATDTQPVPDDDEAFTPVAPTEGHVSDYAWDEDDGWLYYRSGRSVRKVCSFRPEIIEEREHYFGYGDSGRDRESSLLLKLTLKGGASVEVPLPWGDLQSGAKLEAALTRLCSPAYYIAAGMSGHFKTAIYDLSRSVQVRRIYASPGWIEYGAGGFAYLLPSALGAITEEGIDPQVRVEQDEVLGLGSLLGYGQGSRPTFTRDEDRAALDAFLTLSRCGPTSKLLPVVMCILSGPLATAFGDLPPPWVHVTGKTGTLKTSFCLAGLSLFGLHKSSPASWSITPTALQILLHAAKDMTLLVDDYKHALVRDKNGMYSVINNFADRTTRQRASSSQALQKGLTPRANLLTNGEDVWEEEASAQARVAIIEIERDDINETTLASAQRAAQEGTLAQFGGAFVQWLAGRPGILDGSEVQAMHERWVKHLIRGLEERTHRRLIGTVASLMTTATIVRMFVESRYGMGAGNDVKAMNEQMLKGLKLSMVSQAQDVESQAPGEQLLREIVTGLVQGQAMLRPRNEGGQFIPRMSRSAQVVGIWTDRDGVRGRAKPEGDRLVLLSREMTYEWFCNRQLRTGGSVRFSWHQARRELLALGGMTVRRMAVVIGGRRHQVDGVLISYSTLMELEPVTSSPNMSPKKQIRKRVKGDKVT